MASSSEAVVLWDEKQAVDIMSLKGGGGVVFWPRPSEEEQQTTLNQMCNQCAKWAAVTRTCCSVILDRRQIDREAFQADQLRVSATSNLAAIPVLGVEESATVAWAFLTPNATRDAKVEKSKKRPAPPEFVSKEAIAAASKMGAPERALASFHNLKSLSAAPLEELAKVSGIGQGTARKIRKACTGSGAEPPG